MLRAISKEELDLALLDRHTAGVHLRRKGRGIEPFRKYLQGLGWNRKKAGCSEYLIDDKGRPIPDTIARKLIADYACHLRKEGADVTTFLQSLQDDFVREGRSLDCFRHPIITAASKKRSRQQGRDDARHRLQRKKEAITGEMLRAGITRFLPENMNFATASPSQADEAMATLMGLITFHWPNVRISNQARTVSITQARKYTAEWKQANEKAGRPFDEAAAEDWFRKGHSLRVRDVRIAATDQHGQECWMDPIQWRDTYGKHNPSPHLVTMAVMSTKKGQNGDRPHIMTARASAGYAESTICRGIGAMVMAGGYTSPDDLLFSRPSQSWQAKQQKGNGPTRR